MSITGVPGIEVPPFIAYVKLLVPDTVKRMAPSVSPKQLISLTVVPTILSAGNGCTSNISV